MRRIAALLCCSGLAAFVACEFDETVVAPVTGRPVVHLVVNPTGIDRTLEVLLERTLGGRVPTADGRYDPYDPVVSGGGDPIAGARVSIVDVERADTIPAAEVLDTSSTGKGAGVYLFERTLCGIVSCPPNAWIPRRGATYELLVETPSNEVLSARTTIPVGVLRPDTSALIAFDVARDRYTFDWPAVEGLQRYAVQLQTPFGPLQAFSDADSLSVSGQLRNFQQRGFPRAFVPGFIQSLTAYAVDRAYFDYYRTANDPVSGLGLVSNIQGGTGVFAGVVNIRTQFLAVTAPFDEPEDGRFRLVGSDTTGLPTELTVYADGGFVSAGLLDYYDVDRIYRRGALGRRSAEGIRLHVLAGQSARDTAWTMDLAYLGDTLVTTSPVKGTQRWLRVRS